MIRNIANCKINSAISYPSYDRKRLVARIVHLGCGAFHRAHQAVFTHHMLEKTNSDWGICEVSLFSGQTGIQHLKDQDCLCTIAEKEAEKTELKIIGSMVDALHPEFVGQQGILATMAQPQVAIISLTITEKGYCTDIASGKLDENNALIQQDLANPTEPTSAIGYIVEALRLRYERGLPPLTVMSCDNVKENGNVAREAVVGFARLRDEKLAQWIELNVTFPCTMVDRIVPAATSESLGEIAEQLGVYDPCAITCEPFRQWVIEDNFANGRPNWDLAGAQFVKDVVPFETMKLRMLNGSHSFLAYLGYLGGYAHIADTMANSDYRQAVLGLMLQEQAPTLTMPIGTDLSQYAHLLIKRFSNPSLKHQTWQIAMDGSQKLPQRMLDSVTYHLTNGSDYPHLALGIAGWMRYVSGKDEQDKLIDVRDPLVEQFKSIYQQYGVSIDVVPALLAVFGNPLLANPHFVRAVTEAYQQLLDCGARRAVAAL
ncbi:fructuronate reductase [Photorhabdus heterorhabditis]|uniref:D-mannonate oxidoreductase n=1 Tax=Photorhabdus heterorhabditis TaxID=880156 RepID=A0A5B0WM33_9GAMM|nr:fructuronate reductase [Photorhabdus heterorhabditis]KAA1187886.1 fructuronate reductase [Photorhabdus heterorhabditis]KOY63253.1 D-mannonate oxidoreductase [Photorhabdus heterorhabditis]MBS9440197.1 fructuronate reductase [Photorhabdus heterorhabditis]